MLDNHCIHCNEQIANGEDQPLSSYDFVYLPIDFKWLPFLLPPLTSYLYLSCLAFLIPDSGTIVLIFVWINRDLKQ